MKMKDKEGCLENDEKYIDDILKLYNDELNKYKAIVNPGIKRLIEEERVPYLNQLNALYDIYVFQNYLLDNQQKFFNKPGNQTVSLFFSKVAGNLFSIRQCLNVGQLISASSIERDIFETYIDAKLILEKDTEERIKLYEEYQHVQLWLRLIEYMKYLKELEKDDSMSNEKKASEKEYYEKLILNQNENIISENYEKFKVNYHPKFPYSWAWKLFRNEIKDQRNPSREYICKKLGIFNDYLHVYSTSSLIVHNQALMANFMTRENHITSVPIFSQLTSSIAGISASLVLEIILLILKYSESDKYYEIKLYLNYLYKNTTNRQK